MFSSLFGKKSYAFNIDLEVLADPTLLVGNDGLIIDSNQSFTKHLGWPQKELAKESVHMLIPSRVISKRNHDEKMRKYKYGQKSNFIGYDKVLPVKDSHDKEHLYRVRISPVQSSKKTVNFLCFFKPTDDHHVVLNPSLVLEEIEKHLKELPPQYVFRDFLEDRKELVTLRLCKEYLQGELSALKSLIVDNCTVPTMINYIGDVVYEPRTPHLKSFKALLHRTRGQPDVVYLNVIVLRLLFPILVSKHPELKEELKIVFQEIYNILNKEHSNISTENYSSRSDCGSIDLEKSNILIASFSGNMVDSDRSD